MLAMQYSFTLPADFDMDVIRGRVAAKGPLVDGFPGLAFKAFLYARRGEHGPENLYAPFYLWKDNEAMNRLLAGEVFSGVSSSFGWPSVKTWSVLHAVGLAAPKDARYFSREILPIAAHSSLAALRDSEGEIAQSAVARDGALSAVTAFEPTTWTLVRGRFWTDRPTDATRPGIQNYVVGYLATG